MAGKIREISKSRGRSKRVLKGKRELALKIPEVKKDKLKTVKKESGGRKKKEKRALAIAIKKSKEK